jgi:hypothetical protein
MFAREITNQKPTVSEKKYVDLAKNHPDYADIINVFFTNFPIFMTSMVETEMDINKVLTNVEKTDDEKRLKKIITYLLNNVSGFFGRLYYYKSLLYPMAEAVLDTRNEKTVENLQLKTLNIEPNENYTPLLLQFFDQTDIEGFFPSIITTKKMCLQAGNEFLTVIGSMIQELNDHNKTAYEQEVIRVTEKRKAERQKKIEEAHKKAILQKQTAQQAIKAS